MLLPIAKEIVPNTGIDLFILGARKQIGCGLILPSA